MTEQQTETQHKAPTSHGLSDKALKRLVKWGTLALVALVAAFSVVYYLGQHKNMGPSLVDRQVNAAEAAVRADPNNIGTRLALAQLYEADKKFDQALQQYDVVLKALPKNEKALDGKATILLAQGKLSDAQAAFQSLASVAAAGEMAGSDPMLQGARYYLALIAYKKGDYAGAAGQLKEALRLDPTDSDSWFLTAQVAMKQHAPQSAAAAVEKALMFVPSGWCDPYAVAIDAYTQLKSTSQVAFAQARLSLCKGDTAAASTSFVALTSSSDKTVAIKSMVQLAAIAIQAGDTTGARTWFNKVLALDPKNASAKAGLAQLASASPSPTK